MSRFVIATIADLKSMSERSGGEVDSLSRTLGMGSWPLNLRLTLLSIPLGFLHASLTLL